MTIYATQRRISPLTTIRRERLLQSRGEVTAVVGQEVTPVNVIARTPDMHGISIHNLSRELGLTPDELSQQLLLGVGASVQRGTAILRLKGRFGRVQEVKSPVDGILLSHSHGYLIFQVRDSFDEVRAMVRGRVVNVITDYGAIIETTGGLIDGLWSNERENFGILNILTDSPISPVSTQTIGNAGRGAILAFFHLDNLEHIALAEESGVRGIVTGTLAPAIIDGAADFSIPILATDGIGSGGMSEQVLELLRQREGEEVSIVGNSPGEYGQRSALVMPAAVGTVTAGASSSSPDRLEVGQQVQILAGDYAGESGQVVVANGRLRPNQIGLRVPGAEVELTNGTKVFVPAANLDIII